MWMQRHSILRLAVVMVVTILFTGCGDATDPQSGLCPQGPETFTFLEVGRNSSYSSKLRKQMDERLGSSAIARKSIITLSPGSGTLLSQRFPDLLQLNEKLNFPPGERVEHEVVKLMYRNVDKKKMPFDDVELFFSGHSHCMMLMIIRTRLQGDDIVATLREKYGAPQEAAITGELAGKTLSWKKDPDRMVVFIRPDRNKTKTYEIWVYFVVPIQELIAVEQEKRENRSRTIRQSGEKAF